MLINGYALLMIFCMLVLYELKGYEKLARSVFTAYQNLLKKSQ